MADAAEIVQRLQDGTTTLDSLRKEYRCGYALLMRAILSQISKTQWVRIRNANLNRVNKKSRWKKGNVPWNKGMKGWTAGGRSAETRFKKGCIRGQAARNWRAVGTITLRYDKLFRWQNKWTYKDGSRRKGKPRRWIKIRDDGPLWRRWIPYARYLWQQEHGSVPDGYFVVHSNGDQMDDSLENLTIVNRKEHLAHNHQIDPDMRDRARVRACRSRRKNTQARKQLKSLQGPQITFWECRSCAAEYHSEEKPDFCRKCLSTYFEQIRRRQKKTA